MTEAEACANICVSKISLGYVPFQGQTCESFDLCGELSKSWLFAWHFNSVPKLLQSQIYTSRPPQARRELLRAKGAGRVLRDLGSSRQSKLTGVGFRRVSTGGEALEPEIQSRSPLQIHPGGHRFFKKRFVPGEADPVARCRLLDDIRDQEWPKVPTTDSAETVPRTHPRLLQALGSVRCSPKSVRCSFSKPYDRPRLWRPKRPQHQLLQQQRHLVGLVLKDLLLGHGAVEVRWFIRGYRGNFPKRFVKSRWLRPGYA